LSATSSGQVVEDRAFRLRLKRLRDCLSFSWIETPALYFGTDEYVIDEHEAPGLTYPVVRTVSGRASSDLSEHCRRHANLCVQRCEDVEAVNRRQHD
jgi:hypothetical protein